MMAISPVLAGIFLFVSAGQCFVPLGCSDSDTEGQYLCDFRVISLPLSANQFTIQPQHVILEGVSGLIGDDSFVDLGDSSAVFPFPDDVNRMDVVCLKGENVVLSAATFNGLGWLDVLTFTDCKITTLPAATFQPIGVLDTLEFNYGSIDDIYQTSLQDLSIQKNPSIRGAEGRLSLKYTTLVGGRIPDQLLSSLTATSQVEFIGCGISTLEHDAFAGMTSLGSLDLSANNFSYLPLELFTGLTSLGSLTLDDISWDCSACGATWFVDWAYANYVDLGGDIVCASPSDRENVRMLSYFANSCGGRLYSADAFSSQTGFYMGAQFISIQDILTIIGLVALCVANTVFIMKMRRSGGSSSSSKAKSSSKSKVKSKDSKSKDSKSKDSKSKSKDSKSKSKSKSSKKSSKEGDTNLTRRGSGKVTPSDVAVKVNTWT